MSTHLNGLSPAPSAAHSLVDELLGRLPKQDQRIAKILCQHGAANLWSALRELVSNAVDATLETSEAALSPVHIRIHADWIEIEDQGCGMAGRLTGLLLLPASTTKTHKQRIGRMGIGFLTAVSAMTAVAVWSRTEQARRWAQLTLGHGPWRDAVPPSFIHGTLVRAAFVEGIPQHKDVCCFLEREFPFVPVELCVDGRSAVLSESPWKTGMEWRAPLRDVLDLPPALWSARFPLAAEQGDVILWLPREHDERCGRAIVFQQGVLLQSGWELTAKSQQHAEFPPWLLAVVDAPSTQPVLTRTAVAAGASQRALRTAIGLVIHGLIACPPAELLAQVPQLQSVYGSVFTRWCQALDSEHPILLATQWAASGSPSSRTLAALRMHDGLLMIVHGDSSEVEMLWQDYCRLAPQQPLYVRAKSSEDAALLLRVLQASGMQASLLNFSLRQGVQSAPKIAPELTALANSLSRELSSLAIVVEPVRMHSPFLLGVIEQGTLPANAMIAQDLLMPVQSRVLYLNASSQVLMELARARQADSSHDDLLTHDEAILLVACITAQAQIDGPGISRVAPALSSLLRRQQRPNCRASQGGRRHARVLLLGPFREMQVLFDLRAALETHPFYAELARADDWKDVSQVWADVQAKIQAADAYIFDLRARSANVLVELGYVLAYAPQRPFVILSEPNWDLANIGALLTLRPPPDPAAAVTYFATHLPRHGISPERMAAAEPFLSTRHLPAALRTAMDQPMILSDHVDLYAFATGAAPIEGSLRAAHHIFAERISSFNARFDQEPNSDPSSMARFYATRGV